MLRNTAFVIALGAAILFFALGGLLVEARTGQKKVMLEIQGRVSIYAIISSSCIKNVCDEDMQRLVVANTDSDILDYRTLEALLSKNWLVGSWEILISNFLTVDAVEKSLRSSQQLRLIFDKMGCGVDGKLCGKQST